MKSSTLASALTGSSLVIVLALGAYSQVQERHQAESLAPYTRISSALIEVQDSLASQQTPVSDELKSLVQQQLDSLPHSANILASKDHPKDDSPSWEKTFDSSVQKLYHEVFINAAQQSEAQNFVRSEPLEFVQKLQDFAQEHQIKLSEVKAPKTVACRPLSERTPAPESVARLLQASYAYHYASEVIGARTDVDSFSAQEVSDIERSQQQAQLFERQLVQAVSCQYQLPEQQVTYPVDVAQGYTFLEEQSDVLQKNALAVVADRNVPSDAQIFVLSTRIFLEG
ncbi:hypothetical protein ACN083_07240 [Rothia sp. CCM 9418]|uniref:hypothetical protein n=1 Tax=Rothia sp. CCM 9418 TaxID=3402661 RepID=UPI003AD7F30B